MKKIILAALVILVALGAASPMIIGANVENTLKANVARINDMPFYTASIDSYESGYLGARAVVSVGIDSQVMTVNMTPEERVAMQPFFAAFERGIPVAMDIRHGPLLDSPTRSLGLFHSRISLPGDLDLPDGLANALANAGDTQTSLTMGFTGSGELVIDAPAFTFEDTTGRMSFGGFEFQADLESWGLQYHASGTLSDSLFMNTQNGDSINMKPVTLVASADLRNGFVTGTGQFELDMTGIEVVSEADTFTLEHLTMDTIISSPTEELVDVEYRFGLERLAGSTMEEALEDFVIDFSLRNMDKAALKEVATLYTSRDFFQQDPLVIQQQLGEIMANIYSGAQYQLDQLNFRYGDDVALTMSGTVSVDSSLFANPGALQNPFMLIGAVDLELSLDFSQGLADMAYEQFLRGQLDAQDMTEQDMERLIALQKPQLGIMLGQLVQQGMLIASQQGYMIEVSLNDGNLLINGAPGNIPFF